MNTFRIIETLLDTVCASRCSCEEIENELQHCKSANEKLKTTNENLRKRLREKAREKEPEPPTIEKETVEMSFIRDTVIDYLDEHTSEYNRLALDSKYFTTNKADWKAIIDFNTVNNRDYIKQSYDCENFALSFMSQVQHNFGVNTIGLVLDWSGKHAYNILVYSNGDVELFEPQNDNFIDPDSGDLYEFDRVDVII